MDAITAVPAPDNEPVLQYPPGSPERAGLEVALRQVAGDQVELPHVIGGRPVTGAGGLVKVVQPHAHGEVLGTLRQATAQEAQAAITAATRAAPAWRALSFDDRAAILLKAADLLAGPWRARLNAATMLGQSKTVIQAEIDSACELVDFWRFNVHFARQLLEQQPSRNSAGVWNRMEQRPLEGFVYAVTPFNFTAIAGNLPTAPALMGNTVVWKPATTQQRAASMILEILTEAGLPPGVINMVTGHGGEVSKVVLTHPDFAGVHFTGSTEVFRMFWQQIGANIATYRGYPRIVGETGGKDFVLVHPSADPTIVPTALIRGAFDYQGQKCSAASRAYLPASVWSRVREGLVESVDALPMGDIRDLGNFVGAVIDHRAFARLRGVIDAARVDEAVQVLAGGGYDDTVGYFVRPTVIQVEDPTHELMATEYFGPILSVLVYPDGAYDQVLDQLESATPYALTGSVIARDRAVIADASARLRFAAGNFYINDKPTGAVVGQQPFGGARASGTNDKAGSVANLMRWSSPRVIKETFAAPSDHRYPHMG